MSGIIIGGGEVYISFSGGKDSTVLLDIAREMYPDIKVVFVNTGLEYPEVVDFVTRTDKVETIRPKQTFVSILEEDGYPLFSKEISHTLRGAKKYLTNLVQNEISGTKCDLKNAPNMADVVGIDRRTGLKTKNETYVALRNGDIQSDRLLLTDWDKEKGSSRFCKKFYKFALFSPFDIQDRCCSVLKKAPAHGYLHKRKLVPITAQTASESTLRTSIWLKKGCNAFDDEFPVSNPMSFWTEQDVLLYIYLHKLKIASVYGDIVADEEIDFEKASEAGLFDKEHPFLYTTGLQRTGCFACLFGAHLENGKEGSRFTKLQENSNPKLLDWMLRGGEFREGDGKWHPKNGLGYWFVMEWCNKFGGKKFWYPNRDYYISEYGTEETDYWLNNPKFDESENIIRTLLQDMKETMSHSK